MIAVAHTLFGRMTDALAEGDALAWCCMLTVGFAFWQWYMLVRKVDAIGARLGLQFDLLSGRPRRTPQENPRSPADPPRIAQ